MFLEQRKHCVQPGAHQRSKSKPPFNFLFLLKNEANFHINKFEKAHHRAVFSALEIFIENRGCFQCTFHINRNYILEGALLLSFSIVFLCKTRSLFLHHMPEMEHYFVFWVVTKS